MNVYVVGRVILDKARQGGTQGFILPINTVLRYVDVRDNLPAIWIEYDPITSETEERLFEVIKTGQPFGEDDLTRRYVGSYQIAQGVFHIYEWLQGVAALEA